MAGNPKIYSQMVGILKKYSRVIADDAKPAGIGADPLDAADVDAKNLPDWSPEAALAKAEAEGPSRRRALAAARKKRAVRIRKEDVAPKGDSQG